MKKKLLIMCLLFVVVLGSFSMAAAAENSPQIGVEYQIYDTIEEAEAQLNMQNPIYLYYSDSSSNERLLAPDAVMYPFFIRSGDTTTVHMYLHYEGTETASILSIDYLEIYNNKLWGQSGRELLDVGLNIYSRLASGTIRNFSAGTYDIPTTETKLRVDWDNAQVLVDVVGWVSATDPIGAFDVQ